MVMIRLTSITFGIWLSGYGSLLGSVFLNGNAITEERPLMVRKKAVTATDIMFIQ